MLTTSGDTAARGSCPRRRKCASCANGCTGQPTVTVGESLEDMVRCITECSGQSHRGCSRH
eukprot:4185455-Alexandrium_andersonii.AAC.1